MERPKKTHKGIQWRKKMNVHIKYGRKERHIEVVKIYKIHMQKQNCKEKETYIIPEPPLN